MLLRRHGLQKRVAYDAMNAIFADNNKTRHKERPETSVNDNIDHTRPIVDRIGGAEKVSHLVGEVVRELKNIVQKSIAAATSPGTAAGNGYGNGATQQQGMAELLSKPPPATYNSNAQSNSTVYGGTA